MKNKRPDIIPTSEQQSKHMPPKPLPELDKETAIRAGKMFEEAEKISDPVKVVAKIHRISDILYRHIMELVSVCKRGCAYCCYIPVEVSLLEANFIAQKTGRDIEGLKQISLLNPKSAKSEPCPFLDTDSNDCTIYEFRPLACRTFTTLDNPKYCETDEPHYTAGINSGAGLTAISDFLMNKSAGFDFAQFSDIRFWFK